MDSPATKTQPSQSQHASLGAWQRSLLPLMAGLLVVLAAFFFAASLYLVIDIKARIESPPEVPRVELMRVLESGRGDASEMALIMLEENAIARRYHQANISLMARLWTRYLGFITGMILSFVGAAFILGKMRETRTELSAEGTFGKLGLSTTSPGLLMVAMGTILMMTTILHHPRIDLNDAPVFLSGAVTTAPAPALSPPLPWNDPSMVTVPGPATDASAPTADPDADSTSDATTDPATDPAINDLMDQMGKQLDSEANADANPDDG